MPKKKAVKKVVKKPVKSVKSKTTKKKSKSWASLQKEAPKKVKDKGVIEINIPKDMSETTYQQLCAAAKRNGQTLSEFTDQAVLDYIAIMQNRQKDKEAEQGNKCCGGSCGCD